MFIPKCFSRLCVCLELFVFALLRYCLLDLPLWFSENQDGSGTEVGTSFSHLSQHILPLRVDFTWVLARVKHLCLYLCVLLHIHICLGFVKGCQAQLSTRLEVYPAQTGCGCLPFDTKQTSKACLGQAPQAPKKRNSFHAMFRCKSLGYYRFEGDFIWTVAVSLNISFMCARG